MMTARPLVPAVPPADNLLVAKIFFSQVSGLAGKKQLAS